LEVFSSFTAIAGGIIAIARKLEDIFGAKARLVGFELTQG